MSACRCQPILRPTERTSSCSGRWEARCVHREAEAVGAAAALAAYLAEPAKLADGVLRGIGWCRRKRAGR